MTSRDVVNVVQRRLRDARREKIAKLPDGAAKPPKIKVGHCGTLDPLAEGVLVVAVGAAARLVPYVQQQPKRYLGQFRLGASSETGDLENGFVEHPELPVPNRSQVETACETLTGEITQVPPAYSAIWINGQRAYDRVRRGEDVEMPERTVQIHDLKLTEFVYPTMHLDILCGSGTYIRTLGIDVARAVGTTAVMTHLLRTEIGQFKIDRALDIETLRTAELRDHILPPTLATAHLPAITVDQSEVTRLGHGLAIEQAGPDTTKEVAAIDESDNLRALVRRKPRGWSPFRVFPSPE